MSVPVSFNIQPVRGKGLGIVAVRDITAGAVVWEEVPLFTQTRGRCYQSIAESLASKTSEERREYLRLANCYRDKLVPLLGIFETNALPCGENNGLSGNRASIAGIFLCGSRFNSSCIPNVNHRWDQDRQVLEFRALKNVAAGVELCIAYSSLLETRELRRDDLQRKFKFHCHCEACSFTGDKVAESDARRSRLSSLFKELSHWGDRPAQGVKMVKLALRLLREEGLVQYQDHFSYNAFQLCAASSDHTHAQSWIQHSLELVHVVYGPDAKETQQLEKYNEDPMIHPAWGIGSRLTLEGPDNLPTVFHGLDQWSTTT